MKRNDSELLSVTGLCKNYGDLRAVDNLSFKIIKGDIFGLLGPNGAGKSTTIDCILGTAKADTGEVELLGQSPRGNRKKLFQRIGVQFQDSHYPELIKVWELCEMTAILYNHSADVNVLLTKFSLGGMEQKRVSELSGGEKQKLSVVLALINNPEIVFLDELTTGLDPKARRDVWSLLQNLKSRGMTIFLTSHYMDEVSYLCNRILIMDKGKEVVAGTPDSVIKLSGKSSMEDAYLYYIGEEEKNETPVYTV